MKVISEIIQPQQQIQIQKQKQKKKVVDLQNELQQYYQNSLIKIRG
jgi:hypothetical protein